MSIGTPDYTHGVVSPQKLLATVAVDTASVTVTVPQNAETLIVQCWGGVVDPRITVLGTTTHYEYPGAINNASAYAFAGPTYLFDVSPALDEQVTITFNTAPTARWSVYSDAGVHTIVDVGAHRDANGTQFMVPCAPSGGNWGHPTVELQYGFATVGGGGTVIAAPGAGERLRVFAAQIGNFTANVDASLFDSNGVIFCTAHAVNPSGWFTYPLTGIALPTNSAIFLGNGGGTCTAVVIHTTETV